MDAGAQLLKLPVDLEAWLIVAYVGAVLVGARIFEALARMHYHRARRYAEQGFEYDSDFDHYRCPQGERLELHLVEPASRQAVYRAPAHACNGCPLKSSCTPHDQGRHIYRPLAEWAETDIGRFHGRLSLLMYGVGTVISLVGLVRWGIQPGAGLLLAGLVASIASAAQNLSRSRATSCGAPPG